MPDLFHLSRPKIQSSSAPAPARAPQRWPSFNSAAHRMSKEEIELLFIADFISIGHARNAYGDAIIIARRHTPSGGIDAHWLNDDTAKSTKRAPKDIDRFDQEKLYAFCFFH